MTTSAYHFTRGVRNHRSEGLKMAHVRRYTITIRSAHSPYLTCRVGYLRHLRGFLVANGGETNNEAPAPSIVVLMRGSPMQIIPRDHLTTDRV